MLSVQKAILPGTAIGIMFLVLVTGLIASPQMGLAPVPAFAAVGEIAAQSIALELPAPTAVPTPVVEEPQPQPDASSNQDENTASGEGCSIGSRFPDSIQQWCSLIETYAGENGLDPNLVASVMLQESGGNARAYSKSGAVGLMQVMPKDGLAASFMCINGPCFASRPASNELYDPEFNISYGTRMLAGLINRHGSVRDALRAYGPMNMGYRYADIILGIFERYR